MSLLSKLFNSGKRDETFQGGSLPSTIYDVPGGKEYTDTVSARLAGRGVGFGEGYADKYSSPIIQNMRGQFQDYTLPELKSELSATGRRAGSSGFGQIKQAYQQEGNQEGDIFSRLQQRNEDQMRSEINDALGRQGGIADKNAALNETSVRFEKSKNDQQNATEHERLTNQSAGYQKLAQAGGEALMNTAVPGLGSLAGGSSGGFTSSFASPYGNFTPSAPPANYDYSNISSRLAARQGQRGRI